MISRLKILIFLVHFLKKKSSKLHYNKNCTNEIVERADIAYWSVKKYYLQESFNKSVILAEKSSLVHDI